MWGLMKKYFFFLYAIVFLMLGASLASAGTTTLSTYYPAPNGNYNKLTTNYEGIGTAATSPYALLVAAGAGNVGIGTLTPSYLLDVNGNVRLSGNGLYNSSGYQMLQGNAADWLRINQNNSYTNGTAAYGDWAFGTGGVAIGSWSDMPAGQLYVTGNVGIGTTPSAYLLQVNGDIYANGGWLRVSGNQGLYFESYGGGWYMVDSSWIRSYNGRYVYMAAGFDTGSASGVGCGGGLGGGYMFQTCGDIYANGGWLRVSGNQGLYFESYGGGWYMVDSSWIRSYGGKYVYMASGFDTGSSSGVGCGGGLGGGYTFQTCGTIYSTSTITAASDGRLKQNIAPLTGVLSKLDQLRGVSFEWNRLSIPLRHKEGEKGIGMIAQELQKVYPELVVEPNKNAYLSIDYGKFSAVLLQAIKEQQKEIKDLQKEVKKLNKSKN